MSSYKNLGRVGTLLVLAVAASEVLIMISPFAGFFYASARFEPLLGLLSASPLTAWLDGFFLNHSVVTTSAFLEWQRTIGRVVFALGLWGFIISAFQVYGNKILRRGVAKGLLYRTSRHPQYLALGVAGLGLLTIWPRFLLLGIWVTMLFLYAGLSRFEEWRMEERYGDGYRQYAAAKGAFLPGSPVRKLFNMTFGRIKPRALGWAAAYVACLTLAFSVGHLYRTLTRASTVVVARPDHNAMIISAWPQGEDWASQVFDTSMASEEVQARLEEREGKPIVATILPPRYVMSGMYYRMPPKEPASASPSSSSSSGSTSTVGRIGRIAFAFFAPWRRPKDFMGVDPDTTDEPVKVVFSRAEKPFKDDLTLSEALDASVRLIPLAVAYVEGGGKKLARVEVPLPQNNWGPKVVMPLM